MPSGSLFRYLSFSSYFSNSCSNRFFCANFVCALIPCRPFVRVLRESKKLNSALLNNVSFFLWIPPPLVFSHSESWKQTSLTYLKWSILRFFSNFRYGKTCNYFFMVHLFELIMLPNEDTLFSTKKKFKTFFSILFLWRMYFALWRKKAWKIQISANNNHLHFFLRIPR